MVRKAMPPMVLVLTFCLWVAAPAFAFYQNVFVIQHASYGRVTEPNKTTIIVRFANAVPADELLEDEENWLIRVTDIQSGDVVDITPDEAVATRPPGLKSIPTLTVNQALDPAGKRITVRLLLGNFPEFTVGQPRKIGAAQAFAPAKGKADADIYFSGAAAGARGSKPLYTFESKVGYLFNLNRYGALGPRAEINAASESNIDPDSIKTALTYEKIFVFGRANGLILRSDAFGFEFDKRNKNRNIMTDLHGILVLPPHRFNENNVAAMDFTVGFEAGHNFKHALSPNEGLGNLWRWKFGANAYFVAFSPPVFKRIDFATEYKVRLLTSVEPFTETIGGSSFTRLTKKPRHYVGSDLDFMVSDALGLSLKYRYGSQPPAFRFVDHTASVGLTFKLKQANK